MRLDHQVNALPAQDTLGKCTENGTVALSTGAFVWVIGKVKLAALAWLESDALIVKANGTVRSYPRPASAITWASLSSLDAISRNLEARRTRKACAAFPFGSACLVHFHLPFPRPPPENSCSNISNS